MRVEILILIAAWIVAAGMLILFVPKDKIREAQVVFLFEQAVTWLLGIVVVEARLIEYPVKILKHATKTSFSFEYFIYPSICVVFNLHYPEGKSRLRQFMYYFYFCTAITVIEVVLEKYTNIIKYIHWNGYITWVTYFITFYISRKYYIWFFNRKRVTDKLL